MRSASAQIRAEKGMAMSTTNTSWIGGDLWNARVYAGLSIASELAARMDRPKRATLSPLASWQIFRRLGKLNHDLDEIFKEYDQPTPFPPEMPSEMIEAGRDVLLKLYADCGRLEFLPKGVLLNGPINRRLARLRLQSDRILDIADWFDAMSASEETNAKFDAALTDLAQGDVVPWSAVQ